MTKLYTRIAPLFGGLALNIALGMVYSMSNASMYVASYMRWKNSENRSISLSDVSWVYTLNVAFLGIMLPFGGYINRKWGVRKSLYIAVIAFSISTFSAYYFVSSYIWFLIFFGCIIGIADGIAFNLPQYCAYRFWPNNMGLVSSLVISGLALSPVVFSPIQTKIVNPENVMPDLRIGNSLYFSQEEILSRVPFMFLAMGLMVVFLCIIALFTLHEPDKEYIRSLNQQDIDDNVDIENDNNHWNEINKNNNKKLSLKKYLIHCNDEITLNRESRTPESFISTISDIGNDSKSDVQECKIIIEQKGISEYSEYIIHDTLILTTNASTDDICSIEGNTDGELENKLISSSNHISLDTEFLDQTDNDIDELTLLCKLLREKQFWLIFWLIFFFSQYVHFIASWWKNIGIIHIKISDDVLATFGTLITSGNNVFGRLFFGSWIDRFKGKFCFTFISISCLASIVLFQIVLNTGSQLLYLVCIGIIFFNMGAGFVLFPPIVAMNFGVKYFTFIYGIVYIGRSFGVLTNSLLTSLIFNSIDIQYCCFIMAMLTFVFFLLSTRFKDGYTFSDPCLKKKLFAM